MCSAPITRVTRDQLHTRRNNAKPNGTTILYKSSRLRVSRRLERVCCR